MRVLTAMMFVLAIPGGSTLHSDIKAQETNAHREKLIRGKTIDEWIARAKPDRTVEARHAALQVLRNDGLGYDRDRTLRAFCDALADKTPSVRSLAAAGLHKAGKPTDPKAAEKLVELISRDLTAAKPPQSVASRVNQADKEVDFPVREIRALGVIGEADHIPALRKIAMNKHVHQLLRQFAENAIRQIEKRDEELPSESKSGESIDDK